MEEEGPGGGLGQEGGVGGRGVIEERQEGGVGGRGVIEGRQEGGIGGRGVIKGRGNWSMLL